MLVLIGSYIKHVFGGFWGAILHTLHGLFPAWEKIERMVATPDYDHRKVKQKKIRKKPEGTEGYIETVKTEYFSHLFFNLKAAIYHIIHGIFPFIDKIVRRKG